MTVSIYTSKNKLFDKLEATAVYLPATKGDMQVLNNHMPMITSLKEGTIVIDKTNSEKVSVEVDMGYAQFSDNDMKIIIQETKLTTADLKRMEQAAVQSRDKIIRDNEDITETEFEQSTDSNH